MYTLFTRFFFKFYFLANQDKTFISKLINYLIKSRKSIFVWKKLLTVEEIKIQRNEKKLNEIEKGNLMNCKDRSKSSRIF